MGSLSRRVATLDAATRDRLLAHSGSLEPECTSRSPPSSRTWGFANVPTVDHLATGGAARRSYEDCLERDNDFGSPHCVHAMMRAYGIADGWSVVDGGHRGKEETARVSEFMDLVKVQVKSAWATESVRRGVAHYKSGDATTALKMYEQALELDKRHAEAYVARGAALNALNRVRDAAEDFETALKIDPDHRNARKYLDAVRSKNPDAFKRPPSIMSGGRNKLPPPLPIRASAPAAETIARATTLQKPIEPSETPAAAEVKKTEEVKTKEEVKTEDVIKTKEVVKTEDVIKTEEAVKTETKPASPPRAKHVTDLSVLKRNWEQVDDRNRREAAERARKDKEAHLEHVVAVAEAERARKDREAQLEREVAAAVEKKRLEKSLERERRKNSEKQVVVTIRNKRGREDSREREGSRDREREPKRHKDDYAYSRDRKDKKSKKKQKKDKKGHRRDYY